MIDMGDDAEVAGLDHSSPSFAPGDRAASIAGESDHLSYSGEEVNQDEIRSVPCPPHVDARGACGRACP